VTASVVQTTPKLKAKTPEKKGEKLGKDIGIYYCV
jgi:tetrahydromethanopterin S-methyltransferase subunit G